MVDVGGVPTHILAMKDVGAVIVMGQREHPVHPFATWVMDAANGSFYSGRYRETRERAEQDFYNRF
jgi:hypothetical protein